MNEHGKCYTPFKTRTLRRDDGNISDTASPRRRKGVVGGAKLVIGLASATMLTPMITLSAALVVLVVPNAVRTAGNQSAINQVYFHDGHAVLGPSTP
jgi:hypothetical protein